ncbi:porin [Pedobacter sp. HDW13]|uniref:porin n=1 Tax=Pedobacter sp. HDW13 TaxID=2714940 RepID=UPI00140D5674|nr:porin [Pedobacter sp. HDW13]QIL41091.1 porin [Pedobacter sp. HDW13]
MKKISLLIVIYVFIAPLALLAQQKDIGGLDQDTITNFSAYKRSISFAGLLQTRFVGSLTKNVDVNGKNFDPSATGHVTNSFLLKRARLQVKGTVNDHFSANLMFNFAEFNSDPSGKVLENAYVKYTLSKYFNVQAGQFRPFFGIEDALPVDIIRTLDYSNQYYAFGSSGWQSFQIGLSVFGNVTGDGQLPVRYYAGVYNGNNRNQATDNDNSKNVYGRIETSITKYFIVGINAATGSMGAGTGNAWGADVLTQTKLGGGWKLSLGGEYKNGTNLSLFNGLVAKPSLSNVRMQGFYIFPVLRYSYNLPRVRAIEFSSRYEYFDENYKLANTPDKPLSQMFL